jgi:starch phosphorylase
MQKLDLSPRSIAYFSMEAGLSPAMPTYSGGLGVLSGDTLRAAADLGVPMVGVTLLYRKGYFRQHLDAQGRQTETPVAWRPEDFLEPLDIRVRISLEGQAVAIRPWLYTVRGTHGDTIPVFLLDTCVPENAPEHQDLTDHLYGGDPRYRLCQEAVLGLGGVALLKTLGYREIATYHMNEGHSSLLALALLEDATQGRGAANATPAEIEAVRRRCVFTTHTPVPAGHDQFPLSLAEAVLGREFVAAIEASDCCLDGTLNMTYLGLFFSRYVNGVALRHGEISQGMYPGYPISSITNGVHAVTWTSPPFQELFDLEIPYWRQDNFYLRNAIQIGTERIMEAHAEAKRDLLAAIERRTGSRLDRSVMTMGFARRAAGYKRADLLFRHPESLRAIVREVGPLQIVYAGKAHPHDEWGKAIIRRVFEAADGLRDAVRFVYLEEHDMELGRLLCSGVDLWLNTPQKPQEASGTSGMKAALNGVPSFSVLDGWWVEGWLEGVTGWCIGDGREPDSDIEREVASLYNKLGYVIMPLFYSRPEAYAAVMRSTIAINGSFFNAQRMMIQYLENAYHLPEGDARREPRPSGTSAIIRSGPALPGLEV